MIIRKRDADTRSERVMQDVIVNYFLEKNTKILPDEIIIHKESDGRPFFSLKEKSDIDTSQYCISISHTEDWMLADIIRDNLLGVDIESIRSFKPDVLDAFLTTKEKSWLSQKDPSMHDTFATLLWSCKESILKALGTGIRIHPGTIEINITDERHFTTQTQNIELIDSSYEIDLEKKLVITKAVLKKP